MRPTNTPRRFPATARRAARARAQRRPMSVLKAFAAAGLGALFSRIAYMAAAMGPPPDRTLFEFNLALGAMVFIAAAALALAAWAAWDARP